MRSFVSSIMALLLAASVVVTAALAAVSSEPSGAVDAEAAPPTTVQVFAQRSGVAWVLDNNWAATGVQVQA